MIINILDIQETCTNLALSRILNIVKNFLNIIQIIAPILLMVSLTYQLIFLAKNPDDFKKKFPKIRNSALALIIIFIIPTILNTTMYILGEKTQFSSCYNNAPRIIDENVSYEEIEKTDKKNILGNPDDYEKGKKSTSSNNTTQTSQDSSVEKSYGVYLGLDHNKGLDKLYKYKLVVIDLQEFTKEDINKLHSKGIKVYSYLNIGSVEEYRSYFKKFKKIYLGTYENWEDERWVDVSKQSFQNFIINELEPKLRSKGADGYFIDNCNVYANFKKAKIYNGLKNILQNIHQNGLEILINGGDEFVKKAIKENSYSSLFDGVNQEEVFTLINFDNHTYHNQTSKEKAYYQKYLSLVKEKGLKVYLLEYGANSKKEAEIAKYCQENGFSYFNAKTYNLN